MRKSLISRNPSTFVVKNIDILDGLQAPDVNLEGDEAMLKIASLLRSSDHILLV